MTDTLKPKVTLGRHVEILHWDDELTLCFKHIVVDNAGHSHINVMDNDTLSLILNISLFWFCFQVASLLLQSLLLSKYFGPQGQEEHMPFPFYHLN